MRIVLVAPTYYDLQVSVKSLIQSVIAEFGDIEMVVIDEAEIAMLRAGPDLIVSTVPLIGLPQDADSAVVQIGPLPAAPDLEQVRSPVLEIS